MKKDWIARELTVEVVVGVFLVMIFLGLAYFTIILSGEKWSRDKFELEVVFDDVMGLGITDDVVVRGMPIGSVKNLSLGADGVHVFCNIDKKLRMKKDYRITIVSKSMLGGRYVQIHEGSADLPDLPAEVTLHGEQPYDLMSDAAELVGSIKDGFTKGGIMDNLKSTTEKIDALATRMSEGKGTLGKLMSEDDKLYNDLSDAVEALKKIAERIESGQGTLGKLMSEDDSLYKEVEQIVQEVRSAVDDFRETSPVITFSSVFFGAL